MLKTSTYENQFITILSTSSNEYERWFRAITESSSRKFVLLKNFDWIKLIQKIRVRKSCIKSRRRITTLIERWIKSKELKKHTKNCIEIYKFKRTNYNHFQFNHSWFNYHYHLKHFDHHLHQLKSIKTIFYQKYALNTNQTLVKIFTSIFEIINQLNHDWISNHDTRIDTIANRIVSVIVNTKSQNTQTNTFVRWIWLDVHFNQIIKHLNSMSLHHSQRSINQMNESSTQKNY
jgi:hypothetical protein